MPNQKQKRMISNKGRWTTFSKADYRSRSRLSARFIHIHAGLMKSGFNKERFFQSNPGEIGTLIKSKLHSHSLQWFLQIEIRPQFESGQRNVNFFVHTFLAQLLD